MTPPGMELGSVLSTLARVQPFRLLEKSALTDLARAMTVRACAFGEEIFARGEPGDAMYVVVSGKARVVGLNAAGEEVSLALLKNGDYFGEAALLAAENRIATVRAAEDLLLLRLDRADFAGVIGKHPTLRAALERLLREAGIQNFLKEFTALGEVPSRVLRQLVTELEEVRCRPGEVVVQQGGVGDRFYIVRRGNLDAARADEAGTHPIGQIGEGEFFGELALLTGNPRAATVTARTECELFAMSKPAFERILASSPEFKQRLTDQAALYRDERARSAATETAPRASAPAPTETEEEPPPPPRGWRHRLGLFPHILQHDETDCGAACLAMITAFYRVPVGIARLRDLANVDADGATMWSVAQAAEELGFHARGLHLAYDALREITLPAIVHWEGYHYIVLYQLDDRKVLVGDPGLALKRMTAAEFRRGWTGRALELIPTPRLKQTEPLKTSWSRFLPILRQHWFLIAEVFLASIILNLFGLGLPFFTQIIIDRVLVHRTVELLNLLFGGMLLIALFQAAVTVIRRLLLAHISTRADATLLATFYRHLMNLPVRFFDLRRVGDIISRVSENEKIRHALVGTVPGVLLDTLLAIGYIALMSYYNAALTGLVLLAATCLVMLTLAFTPAIRRNRREAFAKGADAWSYLIESFTGIGTVKAMAIESRVRDRLETLTVESLLVERHGVQIEAAYGTAAGLVQMTGSILFLWYGSRQVLAGTMTIGQLLAFTALAANVLAPILRLVEAWDGLQDVRNAVDRLNDIFDARPDEAGGRARLALTRLEGRIKFENVVFRYTRGQDKPTLAGINLEIKPGERLAVVGRSGSGKSTLGKLVLGLYPPNKGRIFIDGHDLRAVARKALRRRIGVVPQEVFLFSGTIRENIALGDPDASLDQVVKAARQAGAHEFISAMGLGYDTKVGERGMTISGGQRQRIALARALLHEPDILLLDEATSALDNESERAIQRNLDDLTRHRTTIVIAHRLSTVMSADRIIVMDAGAIVEQGTHSELCRQGGLYATLVGQQVSE